jgi:hypothetical protein
MVHIHDHYKKAIWNMHKSGNHPLFPRYRGTWPWLLLYHKSLHESSIEMQTFISWNLPDGVRGSSLKKRNRLADNTDSNDDEKGKQGKTGWHIKPENKKMHVARAMEVFGEAAK